MNEKLFDSLLTYSKEQILKSISIFLWISLFFISYNRFISKLDYKTLTSAETFSDYFLSGDYIVLIAWLLCLIIGYYFIKYLLTSLIPSSTVGLKFFINYLIPEEYKIPILNVYYKKAVNASHDHVKKVIEFWDDNSVENNLKNKRKHDLITGIIIKFLFVLFLAINKYSGLQFYIIIISIITCLVLLFLIVISTTSITGKNLVHDMIAELDRK